MPHKLAKISTKRSFKLITGLLLLFILSRIFFINPEKVLFDSGEYLHLFSVKAPVQAIFGGHFPLHETYIILFWPIYQLAALLQLNPAYMTVVMQVFLAAAIVVLYYKIVAFISSKPTALIAATVISLTPLFWITNVTVTVEVAYLFYYFVSLYFLIRYLSHDKNKFIIISGIFFALAFLTYSAVLLWLPLYLSIAFFYKRKAIYKVLLAIISSIVLLAASRILLLSAVMNYDPLYIFHHVYTSNMTQVGSVTNDIQGLLIRIRNFIPVLRNYTSLIVILGFVSLIFCFIKNKKLFVIALLWIIPLLYTNQWWDSVLIGRYSILAGFGFAFLVGLLLNRFRLVIPIVILYLLIVTIPAMMLLKTDTPYLREEKFAKTLPQNSLLIESHFSLPVIDKCCELKILAVNRQDIGNARIEKEIDAYLREKRPVFTSSAALSDPYGLYAGPYLHPLGLSYNRKFELETLIPKYTLKTYNVIDKNDNLIVYQITEKKNSPYPEVMNMKKHYRRLDYYDPITHLYWYIEDLFHSAVKK